MYNGEEFLQEYLDPMLEGRHDGTRQITSTDPDQGPSAKIPVTRDDFIAFDAVTYPLLDPEQRTFVDAVMESAAYLKPGDPDHYVAPKEYGPQYQLHNLCGDGGTGKSFAENVIFFTILFHIHHT
jgi:hypothetical protein